MENETQSDQFLDLKLKVKGSGLCDIFLQTTRKNKKNFDDAKFL